MPTSREIAGFSLEDYRTHVRGCLLGLNMGDLESLRGRRVLTVLDDLDALFRITTDDVRSAIVFLVQDLPAAEDPRLRSIAEAALGLDAESRAIAVCMLTGDYDRFEGMLTNWVVDPAKVDREVERLRAVLRES